MSDPTQIVASKPAITSQTIQGAVIQLVVSLTAVIALLKPADADKINGISSAIQGYVPMIAGIAVAVVPALMTILGRFKASQPVH